MRSRSSPCRPAWPQCSCCSRAHAAGAARCLHPVLPRLLMKLERLGCKKGVVGLVLPTGYSFNLDGTAIYLTLASMFIARACDIR